MNAFNEFGKPNDEIEEFANDLERSAARFFGDMVADGYSATDIRAATSYISGVVDLAGCGAILDIQQRLRKPKIKNGDPILTDEEIEMVLNDQRIPAIKAHRTRTGKGLYEAKKTVDEWIAGNMP